MNAVSENKAMSVIHVFLCKQQFYTQRETEIGKKSSE